MSMSDKRRHLTHNGDRTRNGESKAHSAANKYNTHKLAAGVNHNHYERHHGYESTKHKDEHPPTPEAH